MEIATTSLRILLGVILLVVPIYTYINKDFALKQPPRAQNLMAAFRDSGYLLSFIQSVEVLTGMLLILNLFTPLALLLLLPISVNILLFHQILAPPVGPGLFVFGLNAFLLWAYRANYLLLLQP